MIQGSDHKAPVLAFMTSLGNHGKNWLRGNFERKVGKVLEIFWNVSDLSWTGYEKSLAKKTELSSFEEKTFVNWNTNDREETDRKSHILHSDWFDEILATLRLTNGFKTCQMQLWFSLWQNIHEDLNTQSGNLRILLPFRFLREINFARCVSWLRGWVKLGCDVLSGHSLTEGKLQNCTLTILLGKFRKKQLFIVD